MKLVALIGALMLAGCVAAPAASPSTSPVEAITVSTPSASLKVLQASPSPSSTPKPAIVAKASPTPKPKATPKPIAKATAAPKATVKPVAKPTPEPTFVAPAPEPSPPVFTVKTSCTSIVVDAGAPAWVMIYASPHGIVEPDASQEHVIDANAPTGVQSIALPGDGPYDYGVSITYFDTVEDATGTTSCP